MTKTTTSRKTPVKAKSSKPVKKTGEKPAKPTKVAAQKPVKKPVEKPAKKAARPAVASAKKVASSKAVPAKKTAKAAVKKATPRTPRKTAAKKSSMGPAQKLLKATLATLDDNKAESVVVIDLAGKSAIADYMIIASGRSQRHVASLAEHLHRLLKEGGMKSINIEGARQGDWVLVDGGDIIVHLFRPEVREFYNLEKMWGADLPAEEK